VQSAKPVATLVQEQRSTDCGVGGRRVHPQIAWAKLRALRDGAAIASKKLWS
jgi:5-methyltetrahydropteroyltriglutamate--homocysteine methyltransferase